jgi:CBS domain-containing protein
MKNAVRSILESKGDVVYSIGPEASVAEAVAQMDQRAVGALLVVQGAEACGILTERDVLRRVVAAGRAPANTRVADVMTRELVAISPDVSVEDAMSIVTSKRIRHLPVIRDGRVVGLISSGDLTHWLSRDRDVEIEQLTNYIVGKYPA